MAAHKRFRVIAVIGALVAPLALVAAATAPADAGGSKHKHEVYIYKVEKPIRLSGVGDYSSGDMGTQTLRCDSGDYVLDGMWSVKHVDQYQPPNADPDDDPDIPSVPTLSGQYNDERDVWIQASYPDPSDLRSWKFELVNKAWGDAQVKLFLTCIRGTVSSGPGHSHKVSVRNLFPAPHWAGAGSTANGAGGSPAQSRWYSVVPGQCVNDATQKEYFVAPGFRFNDPYYRPVGTYPINNGLGWVWQFATDGPSHPIPGSVEVYGRCIERRVFDSISATLPFPTPNGPRHSIVMKYLPGVNYADWYVSNIPHGDPQERQYSCSDYDDSYWGYKAAVGWWYLEPSSHWWNNWFLGMEPRPKTRSFYFWNHDGGPSAVRYGVFCINSRTSTPLV